MLISLCNIYVNFTYGRLNYKKQTKGPRTLTLCLTTALNFAQMFLGTNFKTSGLNDPKRIVTTRR